MYDYKVMMLVTESFDESNDWIVPDSEWRVRYKMEKAGIEYEYATYMDFDTSTWKEGLWLGNTGEISETTWNFAAAGWVAAVPELVLPNIYEDNAALLSHTYKWANDGREGELNDVTTSTSIADGKVFTQTVDVNVAGVAYDFTTVTTYDGADFSVTTSWGSCSKSWNHLNRKEDNWFTCPESNGQNVQMHTTTSFGKENVWKLPNSMWKTEFKIEGSDDLIYSTYVDFETMTWMEVLTKNSFAQQLSATTWKMDNAGWVETTTPLSLPNAYTSDAITYENDYKFDIGNAHIKSNVEVNSDDGKIEATIVITNESQVYEFVAKYEWDGEWKAEVNNFNAITTYQACTDTWTVANELKKVCDKGTNAFDVEIETTSSFARWNEWPVRNADVRTQFHIAYQETYFTIYINFEDLTWTEVFQTDDQIIGQAEWNFINSGWNAAANTYSTETLPKQTVTVLPNSNEHTFEFTHNTQVYTFAATYSWDGAVWMSSVSTPSVWLAEELGAPACSATVV